MADLLADVSGHTRVAAYEDATSFLPNQDAAPLLSWTKTSPCDVDWGTLERGPLKTMRS